MEDLFKGEGWKRWSATSGTRYDYYAYSSEQGDFTITQLSVLIPVGHRDNMFPDDNGLWNMIAGYKVMHGALLEYNHLTKELSLYYNNAGMRFQNFEIEVSELFGRNVWISSTMTWDGVEESPDGMISTAIGVIPATKRISDIADTVWDALTPNDVLEVGNVDWHPGTFDLQEQYYGELGVIRAVSASTGNNVLRAENSNAQIEATAHVHNYVLPLPGSSFRADVMTNLYAQ